MLKVNLISRSLLAVTAIIVSFSDTVHANGVQTKVDKDGNVYVVERSSDVRESVSCGDLSARLLAQHISDKNVSLNIVLKSTAVEPPLVQRLNSQFHPFIESQHTLNDMRIGCLTGNGGIGIILQSTEIDGETAHLQVDRYGRVFKNFDQTGFEILNGE